MENLIKLKLNFMTGSNGTVKSDSEGNVYIKKHGHWFLASDWNSDELFQKAVFGGAFGAHKFADNKKLIGWLYFFTCGFFGIGWILDCLEIIFGNYKDSQGKYVLPVSDRRSCVLKMLGGFVITVAYMFIYLFIVRFFGNLLNRLAEVFISNQDGDLENIFGSQ